MNVLQDIQFNIRLKSLTFCKYQLSIDSKQIVLSFPQLLQLRNKVNQITTAENLCNIIENENFVLLFVADREHLFFLEIPKLLDLKDEINLSFNN